MGFDKLKGIDTVVSIKKKSIVKNKEKIKFDEFYFDDSAGDKRFTTYKNFGTGEDSFIEFCLIQNELNHEEWELEEMGIEDLKEISRIFLSFQIENGDFSEYKDENFDLTCIFNEKDFIGYLKERMNFYMNSENLDYEIDEKFLKSLYGKINDNFFISKKIKKSLNKLEIKKEIELENFIQNIHSKLSKYFAVSKSDDNIISLSSRYIDFKFDYIIDDNLNLGVPNDLPEYRYFEGEFENYSDIIKEINVDKFKKPYLFIEDGKFEFENIDLTNKENFIKDLLNLGKFWETIFEYQQDQKEKKLLIEKNKQQEQISDIIKNGNVIKDNNDTFIRINIGGKKAFDVKVYSYFNLMSLGDLVFGISEYRNIEDIRDTFRKIYPNCASGGNNLIGNIKREPFQNFRINFQTQDKETRDYFERDEKKLLIPTYYKDRSLGENPYCSIMSSKNKKYLLKNTSPFSINNPFGVRSFLYELKEENGALFFELNFGSLQDLYSSTEIGPKYSFILRGNNLIPKEFSYINFEIGGGDSLFKDISLLYEKISKGNDGLISEKEWNKYLNKKFPTAKYFTENKKEDKDVVGAIMSKENFNDFEGVFELVSHYFEILDENKNSLLKISNLHQMTIINGELYKKHKNKLKLFQNKYLKNNKLKNDEITREVAGIDIQFGKEFDYCNKVIGDFEVFFSEDESDYVVFSNSDKFKITFQLEIPGMSNYEYINCEAVIDKNKQIIELKRIK